MFFFHYHNVIILCFPIVYMILPKKKCNANTRKFSQINHNTKKISGGPSNLKIKMVVQGLVFTIVLSP